MVVQKIYTVGSIELRKTYSDDNKYIVQVETGNVYQEAIDPLDSTHTYIESENDLPTEQLTAEEQLNYLGVDEL